MWIAITTYHYWKSLLWISRTKVKRHYFERVWYKSSLRTSPYYFWHISPLLGNLEHTFDDGCAWYVLSFRQCSISIPWFRSNISIKIFYVIRLVFDSADLYCMSYCNIIIENWKIVAWIGCRNARVHVYKIFKRSLSTLSNRFIISKTLSSKTTIGRRTKIIQNGLLRRTGRSNGFVLEILTVRQVNSVSKFFIRNTMFNHKLFVCM